LTAKRRRFGYRRLGYLLAREGMTPNHKELLRIDREEKLLVRRRSGRKRALRAKSPMVLPDGPRQCWSQGPRVEWQYIAKGKPMQN
jgi:putative transposase